MAKPSLIFSGSYGASPTVEDLKTDLDTLASKFDGAIGDSDISSVSYSKLVFGGNIVNADISGSAAIAGSKLAANGIAGGSSNQLALDTVAFTNLVAGAVNKLQGTAGTAGITSGLNATDTTLATLSISGPAAGTKFIAFGYARVQRSNSTGEVILGINIDSSDFNPRPTVGLDGNAAKSTGFVIASGTVGTSAIDVKLVAKGDGTLQFFHTSGEAYLFVVQLKKAD